jgi:hypothetical protein
VARQQRPGIFQRILGGISRFVMGTQPPKLPPKPPPKPPPPKRPTPTGIGDRDPLHKNWYQIPLPGYGLVKFQPSIWEEDTVKPLRSAISLYIKGGTKQHDQDWWATRVLSFNDEEVSGVILDGDHTGEYVRVRLDTSLDDLEYWANQGELMGSPVGS